MSAKVKLHNFLKFLHKFIPNNVIFWLLDLFVISIPIHVQQNIKINMLQSDKINNGNGYY